MDLVSDGGGETTGDGEFFVGEQGILTLQGHGDVAEDEDDAHEVSVFIADGRAGVVDEEFCAIAADEDGVVGEGDDAIEALHLGDRVLERLAGGPIDDVEDLVHGEAVGVFVGPAGELLGDVVHGVDASLGVAGDDAVADGLEGRAQLLLGAEGLFGANAEDVEGLAEGAGDILQLAPGVEADDEADGGGAEHERVGHDAGLLTPAIDVLCAASSARRR